MRSERVHEKETSTILECLEHCLSDRVKPVLASHADPAHEKASRWSFLLRFGGWFCFQSAATPFAASGSRFLLATRTWRFGDGSSPNQNQKNSHLPVLYGGALLARWGAIRAWLVWGRLDVQSDEWVFANGYKLLFAAVRPEAKVVDPVFVVLRFAFHDCVLRLEATLGLVNGLTERTSAVLGDADVQRCGAVCHEIPLKSNTANQGISRFLVQEPLKNSNKLSEPACLAAI